jgi:hypothetical protein
VPIVRSVPVVPDSVSVQITDALYEKGYLLGYRAVVDRFADGESAIISTLRARARERITALA